MKPGCCQHAHGHPRDGPWHENSFSVPDALAGGQTRPPFLWLQTHRSIALQQGFPLRLDVGQDDGEEGTCGMEKIIGGGKYHTETAAEVASCKHKSLASDRVLPRLRSDGNRRGFHRAGPSPRLARGGWGPDCRRSRRVRSQVSHIVSTLADRRGWYDMPDGKIRQTCPARPRDNAPLRARIGLSGRFPPFPTGQRKRNTGGFHHGQTWRFSRPVVGRGGA